ncbi:MAG: histidine phosphatase family protein [Verrucomicrobiaceae bacterium]|nr:histidine phosphatase family protein [Verrucomicrobiaceae bacterium]
MELENRSSRNVISPPNNTGDVGPPDDPTASPRIFYVRHGETEWTFTGQHTGLTDIPLTALGEDEVREWGQRLVNIPFDHVLTSPRQRARRTCELVGLCNDAETEADLAEWDYGDYEGMRSVDIRKEQPGWNVFRDGCPDGESPEEIAARADRLIARLRTMQGNIALFSHGQFGGVLAARWLGLSVVEAQHFTPSTASLSILSNNPHHPDVPVIELWNALPHGVSRSAPAPHPHHHMSMRQSAFQRWENEGGNTSGVKPNERP